MLGWVRLGARLLKFSNDTETGDKLFARLGFNDEANAAVRPMIVEFLRFLVPVVVAVTMSSAIASRHMESVTREAILDDELMGDPVTALMLTLLYATLGLSDWPERLGDVYSRHVEHGPVAAGLRGWALMQYRTTPDEREAARLETVLARIYQHPQRGSGQTAVMRNAVARDDTSRKLRGQRRGAQHARLAIEPKLDPLDVEDN